MKHLRKFESNDNNNVNHYQLRQKMEVKGLPRKQGDSKEIIINNIGTIKEIIDRDDDIAYNVEFPVSVEYGSPWSKEKWTEDKSIWTILHNGDSEYIVKVF